MSGLPWPAGFADGVKLFDAGAFFEAHEAFEELLDAVEGDSRWDLLVALRPRVAADRGAAADGRPAPAEGPRLVLRHVK